MTSLRTGDSPNMYWSTSCIQLDHGMPIQRRPKGHAAEDGKNIQKWWVVRLIKRSPETLQGGIAEQMNNDDLILGKTQH